jgi:hypothetical protein
LFGRLAAGLRQFLSTALITWKVKTPKKEIARLSTLSNDDASGLTRWRSRNSCGNETTQRIGGMAL